MGNHTGTIDKDRNGSHFERDCLKNSTKVTANAMKHLTKNKKSRRPHRPPAHETNLGNLLRAAREKRHLTLRDVEAETGLLSGGVSFLENGRSIPDLLTAHILCKFYGIPLKKLAAAFLQDEA